jgi:hypothetical protein
MAAFGFYCESNGYEKKNETGCASHGA